MRIFVAVAGAALLANACTTLLTPSGAAATRWANLEKQRAAKQMALAGGEERICKNMPVMGSNMPQKVCSTQEEWDSFDKQGREGVEAMDQARQGMGTPTAGEQGP